MAREHLTAARLLRDKVMQHPQIIVHIDSEVESFAGTGGVDRGIARTPEGEQLWHPAAAFVFIGLDPNTGWLGGSVAVDPWGFLVTDGTFAIPNQGVRGWRRRAGSTKQLGAAVGDGIAALIAIRSYLQAHSDLRRWEVNA